MPLSEADVLACLKNVVDPNTGRDFVTAKEVKKIAVSGADVTVDVALGYPAKSQHEALKKLVHFGHRDTTDARRARNGIDVEVLTGPCRSGDARAVGLFLVQRQFGAIVVAGGQPGEREDVGHLASRLDRSVVALLHAARSTRQQRRQLREVDRLGLVGGVVVLCDHLTGGHERDGLEHHAGLAGQCRLGGDVEPHVDRAASPGRGEDGATLDPGGCGPLARRGRR